MNYAAALFDMNGVIVDDEALHEAAFTKVLKNRGFSFGHDEYIKYFAGRTDAYGFESFFELVQSTMPAMEEIGTEKANCYMELAAESLEPYPGILAYIRTLHDAGVRLALVTSSISLEVQTILDTFAIADLFEVVITADDITESKPSPQGYLMAAEKLGLEPQACLVIEDAPSGVAAARAASMDCIAVTNTHSASELSEATKIVASLSESDVA